MNTCLNCKKETHNPKFCSKSCSVSYNNRLSPKRIAKPYLVRRCMYCREKLEPIEYYKNRRICDNCKALQGVKRSSESYPRVKRNRKENKNRLLNEFGNKCFKCGYNNCPDVLEFHHRNPLEKGFTLSYNMGRSYEELFIEAKKCVVLCANCHRELEAGVWSL